MGPRRQSAGAETRAAILDVAERLVQVRGFNAFSYADVASELGVTTAAVHYHFPSKAELGEELLLRYAQRFAEALVAIDDAGGTAPEKLRAYADLYLGVLREDRMCLCGMLAAEYQTLPGPMRDSMVGFFDDNHTWLATVLDAGRAEGSLEFGGSAIETAQMIVGTLEGAMLVARPYGDSARFESVADQLIAELVRTRAATV